MEDVGCQVARTPLSSVLARSSGKDKPIQLVPGWLQKLPEDCLMQNQPPIELHSRFSVGVYSPSLCHSHDIRKAAEVFGQSFPSLREVGSTGLRGTCDRPWT